MTAKRITVYLLITLTVAALTSNLSHSQTSPLTVSVTTAHTEYYYRQLVQIFGNVTYEGQLVEEGLVAIQLQNPNNKTIALRTVPANAFPSQSLTEIESIIPCDMGGNLKESFRKETTAYFKVTIKNNRPVEINDILITVTLCDVDSTPFFLRNQSISSILGGGSVYALLGAPINDWVSTGQATAYANLYQNGKLPKDGGHPLSPEKSASFAIVESGGSSSSSTSPETSETGNATFQAAIRLPPLTPLGTYFVSISVYYQGWKAFNTTALLHQHKILADVIFDRTIDIADVVAVTAIYGLSGGYPRWNPEVDLVPDGKIDIADVVKVTGSYGMSY